MAATVLGRTEQSSPEAVRLAFSRSQLTVLTQSPQFIANPSQSAGIG
jgi:hypothetical protein